MKDWSHPGSSQTDLLPHEPIEHKCVLERSWNESSQSDLLFVVSISILMIMSYFGGLDILELKKYWCSYAKKNYKVVSKLSYSQRFY